MGTQPWQGSTGNRAEKVKKIYERFAWNRDGGLDREELAGLVLALYPWVAFSDEQMEAIVNDVFRTYGEFIDGEKGLTCEGLLRTYDDGAGDVDQDFITLGLELDNPDASFRSVGSSFSVADASTASFMSGQSSFSLADDEPILPQEPSDRERTDDATLAPATYDIVFDDTQALVNDLDRMIQQLRAAQLKGKNIKLYSSNAWIPDRSALPDVGKVGNETKIFVWKEGSRGYPQFAKEVAAIRGWNERSRSEEAAFDGHMAMGCVLYEHQLFKESLTSFNRACHVRQLDARPYFQAGKALYALRRFSQARESYTLALEAAEQGESQWADLLPHIHIHLGFALERERMVHTACDHYREALILSPANYRALKFLGTALFAIREYGAAEKVLGEAILLKPDYADAHCNLGAVLHAMGEDEKAMQAFRKAIDLRPGHGDALYNLGCLLRDTGRYHRASEIFTRVLTVWPDNWLAQMNKAISLLEVGEVEEARKALKKALEMANRVELSLWPRNWRGQLKKSVSLLGGGKEEEARRVLKETFESILLPPVIS